MSDIDALLRRIHKRVGGGVDIQTFATNEQVEVRWRRLYGEEWSDQRYSSAPTLSAAPLNVLRHEDQADANDDFKEWAP